MIDRVSSGADRLDSVLGGGLPRDSINLFIGPPGSGKTILAQQYLFHHARTGGRGLYVSTVSEPFDKILRYGELLSFFDTDAVGRDVVYEDLGEALCRDGLPGVLDQLDRFRAIHSPSMVVIDSFKALRAFSDDESDFRRFLHDCAGRLTAAAGTSVWIGEHDHEQMGDIPEFAVADAIVALSSRRTAERERRVLQVLKLRGSDFRSGEHAYRIGPDGLMVFPRLADDHDTSDYALDPTRASTGIPALDDSLGAGYWPGAVTMVAGPTGSGKTLMGLHFLFRGADQGEPGLLATFQEHTTQLHRIAAGFGWAFGDGVEVLGRSPVDLYLDEWVYDLLAAIDRTGARRVVVDSLGDLRAATVDSVRFREMFHSLSQRLARRGISLLVTNEILDLFEVRRLSDDNMAHIADNVVLLHYVRDESEIRHALLVLKTRGSDHRPEIRQFHIGPDGITLGDPFGPGRRFA